MKTDTSRKIIEFVRQKREARADDLIRQLGLSRVAIHRQLKKLVERGILRKTGRPPRVFYLINQPNPVIGGQLPADLRQILNDRYLYITASGEIVSGAVGFQTWLKEIGKAKELESMARRYQTIRLRADEWFNRKGWIEATAKLKASFAKVFVKKMIYLDFYSLPEFGKTRLGNLVLYAKQSQSRELVKQLTKNTSKAINRVIAAYKIQAVSFVPHTVPRQLQFLSEYRRELNLTLPEIKLVKSYRGQVIVAQKTLSRLEERITNARETIFIGEPKVKRYVRVLLIDDAVGSGATLNETAKKLIEQKIAKMVYGFSIVGSFKGFDIIREV